MCGTVLVSSRRTWTINGLGSHQVIARGSRAMVSIVLMTAFLYVHIFLTHLFHLPPPPKLMVGTFSLV